MSPMSELRNHAPNKAVEPDMPDMQLVIAAANGSEAAVRELVRRYNPRLYRVARGVLACDAEAEDVVQETYLAVFTHLDSFRGDAAFSTWITRIAINTALMRLRRERPREEYDTVNEHDTQRILPFPGQSSETAETQLGRNQWQSLLEEAVTDLPHELRLVFLMRETEGMSLKEIGRDLELNPLTVKTRLFRARRLLKRYLERRVRGGFEAIFPFNGKRCTDMADRVVEHLRTAAGHLGSKDV